MTNDVKAWLSRCYELGDLLEHLAARREEMYSRLTGATGSVDRIGGTKTKDPHLFDALAGINYEISKTAAQLDESRLEVFRLIQSVNDRRYRIVLMGRYYECQSWAEIGAFLGLEVRQIYRIHGEALKAAEARLRVNNTKL